MRRLLLTLCFALATSSLASAQQMFNLYVGGVTPRAEDARSPASRADCRGCSDDVLVNDLDFLLFNISDFNTATVGGEYVVGLGDRFDASLGIGIYQRSVPSIYSGFTN